MRAVVVSEPGPPEVLRLGEVDRPSVGAGELLVRVVAAGVNRADVLQRQGHYPPPPGASETIGLEVSGTVAELGDGVSGHSVGEPCLALLAGGGYAEYVAVPAGQVVAPPDGADLVTAAGVMEVAATVSSNLDRAALKAGEVFLVHGGAGGIGEFAIQYARALGATVVTTAGSDAKLEHCRRLGADHAVSYRGDWVAEIRTALGGGVDVILDNMGAKYLEAHVGLMNPDGRLMVIGMQGGTQGTLDLGALLPKRASVTAMSLRGRPTEQKAAICRRVVETVWPMIADGRVRIAEPQTYPLAEAAAAHARLESADSTGKIVLTVADG